MGRGGAGGVAGPHRFLPSDTRESHSLAASPTFSKAGTPPKPAEVAAPAPGMALIAPPEGSRPASLRATRKAWHTHPSRSRYSRMAPCTQCRENLSRSSRRRNLSNSASLRVISSLAVENKAEMFTSRTLTLSFNPSTWDLDTRASSVTRARRDSKLDTVALRLDTFSSSNWISSYRVAMSQYSSVVR